MTTNPTEKRCCARAELTAMLLNGGSVSFRGEGRYAASISAEQAAVARYAGELVQNHTDLWYTLRMKRSARLGGQVRYQLSFDEDQSAELLSWLDLLDPGAPFGLRQSPSQALTRRECCRRAYLGGAFFVCGWVSAPEKAYELEFAAADEHQAEVLIKTLKRCGVNAKSAVRKNQSVVYVKDGDQVATVLGLIGAHGALLELENVRVLKGVRNAVNRQVNCDARNLESSLGAARRQIEDILYIRDHGGLDALPKPLRQIAELRLEHEEATLVDLGAMLEPPIGKSGVNNRLRRLGEIARGLREKE